MEKPFLMLVEDVFHLSRGGLVMATGRIERGLVRKGDRVELIGFGSDALAHVTDIDVGGLRVDEAGAGTNIGLLLPGAVAGAVERGQVLAAPGSIGAHTAFTADITMLPKEQGGTDVLTGEGLHVHVLAAAVRGVVTLPRETGALRPLHIGTATITLERPVALEEGRSFAVRRHGRAVGSGAVTRLLP
ncbi:EF-Tu/IF-2/RF-3 family GTPase [Kitasatospora sp. NPDC018058]|uniref:EF-Tu C-terminal domain-related protein n=1 Tax=Kitasatospora sp. NPDC018058 TaxID=3364025 RepID=UPI0037BE7CC6